MAFGPGAAALMNRGGPPRGSAEVGVADVALTPAASTAVPGATATCPLAPNPLLPALVAKGEEGPPLATVPRGGAELTPVAAGVLIPGNGGPSLGPSPVGSNTATGTLDGGSKECARLDPLSSQDAPVKLPLPLPLPLPPVLALVGWTGGAPLRVGSCATADASRSAARDEPLPPLPSSMTCLSKATRGRAGGPPTALTPAVGNGGGKAAGPEPLAAGSLPPTVANTSPESDMHPVSGAATVDEPPPWLDNALNPLPSAPLSMGQSAQQLLARTSARGERVPWYHTLLPYRDWTLRFKWWTVCGWLDAR